MTTDVNDPNWLNYVDAASATAEVNPDVIKQAYGSLPAPISPQVFNNVASLHPSVSLDNPQDASQIAQATALHLNATNGVLTNALLREPTPAEQYIGLKIGPANAPDVLTVSGDLPLSTVVPPSVLAQNPDEFEGINTVGEYRAKAAAVMGPPAASQPAMNSDQFPIHANLMKPGEEWGNPQDPDFASQHITTITAPRANPPTPFRWLSVPQAASWNKQEDDQGLPHNFIATNANIESGGRPYLRDPGNSNMGLHQFEAGDMQDLLGHPANPLDPEASTEALIAEAKRNQTVLSPILGHDPSGGELYVAHQQGTTGAKALFSSPDASAVDVLQGVYHDRSKALSAIRRNIPDNDPLHQQDPSTITSKQFTDMWVNKFNQQAGDTTNLLSNNNVNLSTTRPVTPLYADDKLAADVAQRNNNYNLAAGVMDSAVHESSLPALVKMFRDPYQDPNFLVTGDMVKNDPRLQNVPPDLWPSLSYASSKQDYDNQVLALQRQAQYEQRVSQLGGSAWVAKVGGALLDPPGWLAGAVSPLGDLAKAAQVGRILRYGAAGADFAMGNLAADVPRMVTDPSYSKDQALYTAAGGFLFGLAGHGVGEGISNYFGKIHPALKGDVQAIETEQHGLMNQIDQQSLPAADGSVGSATNDYVRTPVRADVEDWVNEQAKDEFLGNAAYKNVRMDLAGQLKGSDNPVTAALGNSLVEDAVGNRDHSAVGMAVTVEQRMIEARLATESAAAYNAAWADYRQRNGISMFNISAERDFRTQVADFIDNTDRAVADAMDPAVKQYGGKIQDLFGTYHDLGQNPGKLDGSVRAAIPGLANIPKNDLYFPHLWDPLKFGEADRRFKTKQMKAMLEGSIKDALPEILPGAREEMDNAAKAYEEAQGKHVEASNALKENEAEVASKKASADGDAATTPAGSPPDPKVQQELAEAQARRDRQAEKVETYRQQVEAARAEHERVQVEGPTIKRDELAKKLASGLYDGLRNVHAGQEVSLSRILSGDDRAGLAQFLEKEAGMSRADIEAIMKALGPSDGAEGSISRLKHRTTLNVHYEHPMVDPETGKIVPTSVKSLMERDAVKVFHSYNRQLSAQVALGRLRIENPRFDPALHEGTDVPRYLVDGVHSGTDWDNVMKQVKAVGDEMGQDPKSLRRDTDRLNFVYNSLTGQLHLQDKGTLGSILRLLRKYNFTRALGQVGFAHVAQTWSIAAQMGLKAAVATMPALRDFIRDAKTGQLSDAYAREIEYIADPGTDWIRGITHMSTDDFGNPVGQDGFRRAEDIANRAARVTMAISGMAPMLAMQQKWAAKAALARFVFDAEGKMPLNMRRMAALGIDQDTRDLIAKNILDNRGTITGEDGREIPVLNIDKWDPEARHALSYAVFNWTRKIAQENDLGQMNLMLGSEMGKLMWQFRMFMFGAYAKQTLHNIHMADPESLSMVLGTAVLGGLAYTAQTYLQSVGRSDQQQFLDQKLTPKALALAGIQRSPMSSVAPAATDLLTYAAGFDPIFDARASGTPAQGLLSNPTFSLADNAVRATHGLVKSGLNAATGGAVGSPLTQQDVRAGVGVLPWSNFLPVVWASNAMMQGLPVRDPAQHTSH